MGVRWVQFRHKVAGGVLDLSAVKNLCREAADICAAYDVQFIINDFASWALEIPCSGVHLGRSDMPISQARELLGSKKIIGATANTLQDVLEIFQENAADYIGLGPYRVTQTKENLAPILGYLAMKNIIDKARNFGVKLPFIAVGGVRSTEAKEIRKAGCQGIAACGVFLQKATRLQEYVLFNKVFNY